MRRPSDRIVAAALFTAFFALYAFTAQRGLGWGDSGEFQHRILDLADGMTKGCDSLATAHPLYVLLGKCVASSPFAVSFSVAHAPIPARLSSMPTFPAELRRI